MAKNQYVERIRVKWPWLKLIDITYPIVLCYALADDWPQTQKARNAGLLKDIATASKSVAD
jgi:hypothetical protein